MLLISVEYFSELFNSYQSSNYNVEFYTNSISILFNIHERVLLHDKDENASSQWLIAEPRVQASNPAKVHHSELKTIQPCNKCKVNCIPSEW